MVNPPTNKVQVARSADHGASFIYGVADQNHSLIEGYGGFGRPDIKIGPFGTAHLVYPKARDSDWSYVAILYKYSRPPYETWSSEPMRLDDNVAEANVREPRLAVGACGRASVLHATWVESLNGTDKILYTRKVAHPGCAWSDPLRVGRLKNGISTNGLAAARAKAFSVFAAPLFGSRVSSGVICP